MLAAVALAANLRVAVFSPAGAGNQAWARTLCEVLALEHGIAAENVRRIDAESRARISHERSLGIITDSGTGHRA